MNNGGPGRESFRRYGRGDRERDLVAATTELGVVGLDPDEAELVDGITEAEHLTVDDGEQRLVADERALQFVFQLELLRRSRFGPKSMAG